MAGASPGPARLPVPRALLLDFGGVVAGSERRAGWAAELAAEVYAELAAAGCHELSAGEIEADLAAGYAAVAAWRDAMSRPFAPREIGHAEFWCDFVAADWPEQARSVVRAHATPLCRRLGELREERAPRGGIAELLETAATCGVRAGIASNALSGAVHREFLAASGLDKHLAVQVYSDEAGVRKPNPELLRRAAAGLGVPVQRSWYVGDRFDRDVTCGRRAGVGATVLMVARGTYDRPYPVRAAPDAVVAGPAELRRLLVDAVEEAHGGR